MKVGQRSDIALRAVCSIYDILATMSEKPTFGNYRPVSNQSSLGAFWIAKDAKFLHAHSDDSDQTARMRRLI